MSRPGEPPRPRPPARRAARAPRNAARAQGDGPRAGAAADLLCARLGEGIRARRAARALTLRELGERAGVSQRFLVSLEAGRGNPSVVTLSAIAGALATSAAELLTAAAAPARTHAGAERRVIALLGLRGAGKSAIGARAARTLALPFLELDALVAERAGMTLESVFELHGADHFRRLEREALRATLAGGPALVATGGGLVTDEESYARLRAGALTVFLRASAEDHWNRVVAQGDARPMHNRRDAMHELRAILRARLPLYERADHVIDTSALGLAGSVAALVRIARSELPALATR